MIFILVLAVAFMAWVLVVSLKTGEFRYKSRGQMGARGIISGHVKKSERPGLFWTLAAIHLGLIAYVVSLAFEL